MKIDKKNQFQIGEVFQFGLIKLKCISSEKENYCNGCFFEPDNCIETHLESTGPCAKQQRHDKTDVIFVKSED